jgi:hypothetical protein
MLRRIVLAIGCLAWLVPATPAAGEQATLILRSGERISGDLWDLYAAGFRVKVNGQDRDVATSEVAVIDFTGSQPSDEVRRRAASGQPFAITRGGEIVEGRLTDIGGTVPLRLTFQTSSGERNMTSAEVSQIVLAPVADGRSTPFAVGTTGQGGAKTFSIPGNQKWLETDMLVREGETLTFRADGQVSFAPNQRTGPAGVPRGTRGADTPLPSAPAGVLIGRIDEGQPFVIGSRTSVPMPASGRLWLGINDDVVDDNSGEFRVMVAFPGARR